MENIIPIFFCVLLFVAAIRWMPLFKQSGLRFLEIVFFFGLKILFGFALLGVYTKFYPQRNLADVFKYFDDACILYNNAHVLGLSFLETFQALITHSNETLLIGTHHFDKRGSGFFEANHHLIIYIHFILRYFSFGNIYLHSLWFSFFSLVGAVGIYSSLKKHFAETTYWLKGIVFCIPSVLFWGSGMLKETLIVMGLGILAYAYTERTRMADWKSVSLLLLSLCLFLFIKPYVLLGVVLAAFVYWLFKQENAKQLSMAIAVIGAAILFFFGNHWANQLIHKRNEFITLSEHTQTQSLLHRAIIPENGITELLKITPGAVYAVLFEPSIVHLKTFKDLPFCIENIVILLGLIVLLLRYPTLQHNKLAISAALLSFVVSQFMIIGWTVPVSGAIVRYKVSALPFLVIGVLMHVNLNLFICDIKSHFFKKKEDLTSKN
ncbi:MAG: hypothetical protein JNL95_00345 [Chitinophagales bacterium]|nr:hypothetical protein [Chitinophagales bacterium]